MAARLVRQNVCLDFFDVQGLDEQAAAETGDWYEIVERPLDPSETGQARLFQSWEALRDVQGLNEEALSHLRVVLNGTLLGRSREAVFPLFVPTDLSRERRPLPTAAHPRAYQGTKYKPPKKNSPPPVDLRIALCDPKFLSRLPLSEAAEAAGQARLPERFRLSLYPLVRHQSQADVADTLALYWELDLERRPAQLAAVTYLMRLRSDANARRWCRVAAGMPEHWRTPLLHLLIASGADQEDVLSLPPSFLEQLAEALDGPDALYRAYWLLHGLAFGIAPDYLRAGFRLQDALGGKQSFHDVERSGFFPEAAVAILSGHLANVASYYKTFPLYLWERCGQWQGLGEIVEAVSWTDYTPDVAYRYLRLVADCYWDDLTPEQEEAKWQFLQGQVPAIDALLRATPETHQLKCLDHLGEYFQILDTPEELAACLPAAYALTHRLAQPPFAKDCDTTDATVGFLRNLTPPLRERFLNAPEANFRRLEEACRRRNDLWLVGRGTDTLTRRLGEFSLCCFEAYPALLFKVAKLLGGLPHPVRDQSVTPLLLSPLFDDLEGVPAAQFAALVEAHRDPEAFQPVPPKLREHVAGVRTLPPPSLDRAVAQMRTQILRTGLETLELAILRTLERGFPVEARQEAVRHALGMERLAGDNRRTLRKFLKAYWGGEREYRQDHPLTRNWMAKHPRLPLGLWLKGVEYQTAGENGPVRLATEPDPLEALKLGTYVGSCLGLGGSFAYSAAAVVLDVNKQVVYARDARGTVLARQVVAVSEDDHLVCYSVYPLNARPEMQKAFAEYDLALSRALGLPLHDAAGEDDYAVAHILSHDWWDDGVWNPKRDGLQPVT